MRLPSPLWTRISLYFVCSHFVYHIFNFKLSLCARSKHKKKATTTRRRWRRRRARIAAAVEPFFWLWFSLVFLCLACTFAKCRTQVATVAASRASSSSSSYTRGCENSSLAFQKLNCIFPKKGTGNTRRRALHEHGVGDWFEQSENQIIGIYFSFWLCHPPLPLPACRMGQQQLNYWSI